MNQPEVSAKQAGMQAERNCLKTKKKLEYLPVVF
jgi:hypothetical protein